MFVPPPWAHGLVPASPLGGRGIFSGGEVVGHFGAGEMDSGSRMGEMTVPNRKSSMLREGGLKKNHNTPPLPQTSFWALRSC